MNGIKEFQPMSFSDIGNPNKHLDVNNTINMIPGDDKLGNMLSTTYLCNFFTPVGKIASIKHFMEYINTPKYPEELLVKPKLTRKDLAKIPKNKITVVNYWAAVASVVAIKIQKNNELKKLLTENDKQLNIFTEKETKLFGTEVKNYKPVKRLSRYVSIIRIFEKMLKAGDFTDENILKQIDCLKDDRGLSIYHGIANIEVQSSI